MKKNLLRLSVIIGSVMLMSFTESESSARPWFGTVTTCTDQQCNDAYGGTFACSVVNTKRYFFTFVISDGNGDNDGAKYGTCASNGY